MTATRARGCDDGRIVDLCDVDLATLDPQQLASWQTYLRRYFNETFVGGMGAEDVLRAIAGHFAGGRWLDLGCGTSTLFWGIGATGMRRITAADASPEALVLLRALSQSRRHPRCYEEACAAFGRSPDHIERLKTVPQDYWVLDAFDAWSEGLAGTFDTITAIGLFGLASTPHQFRRAVASASLALRPAGRLVAANWRRREGYARATGHATAYVDDDLVARACHDAALSLLHCARVPIAGDELFDSILVWAAAKARA